jgi:hypothetical protein
MCRPSIQKQESHHSRITSQSDHMTLPHKSDVAFDEK